MLRKVTAVLFTMALVFSVSLPIFAQDSMAKEARVEGRVVRTSKDKMMITVRSGDNNAERQVIYDASTKFTSQYHADKKVNAIDADQIKEGDYVICTGSFDDQKIFHATAVSKRLSHPS
jgi:hypothetical protein